MTEPISYVTKEPHNVQAMQYKSWDGTGQAVKDWILSFLTASFEEAISIADDGYGYLQVLVGEDPLFEINNGQYVYLDEDGFHTATPSAFEIYYKKATPV